MSRMAAAVNQTRQVTKRPANATQTQRQCVADGDVAVDQLSLGRLYVFIDRRKNKRSFVIMDFYLCLD